MRADGGLTALGCYWSGAQGGDLGWRTGAGSQRIPVNLRERGAGDQWSAPRWSVAHTEVTMGTAKMLHPSFQYLHGGGTAYDFTFQN